MRQPYERRGEGVLTVILERCALNLDVRALKDGLGRGEHANLFRQFAMLCPSPLHLCGHPFLPRVPQVRLKALQCPVPGCSDLHVSSFFTGCMPTWQAKTHQPW